MRVVVSFLIGEKECLSLFVVWPNVRNASCRASKPCWNKPLTACNLLKYITIIMTKYVFSLHSKPHMLI